jgi:hypothetical protein
MARKRTDQITRTVAEVEQAAKRLRADIRKQAKKQPVLKALLKAAQRLRGRAAAVAGQMEKYVHQMRMELEAAPPARRAARRGRVRRAA